MAADWTAFSMANALRTAVESRVVGYTPDVRVLTYLPTADEQASDFISIGYMSNDSGENQRAHAGGPRFDEEVTLTSRVQVIRPGAGQDIADAVRARARALLAEVDDEVRDNLPTVGDQAWNGRIIDRDAATFATSREGVGAMIVAINFNVFYKARTS